MSMDGIYRYWPIHEPTPPGWEDTGTDLRHHGIYSRLIKMTKTTSDMAGDVLAEARDLVTGDRAKTHGDAAKTYAVVAALWSAYLGIEITTAECLMMHALAKVGRDKVNPTVKDNCVDASAYPALSWAVRPRAADEEGP